MQQKHTGSLLSKQLGATGKKVAMEDSKPAKCQENGETGSAEKVGPLPYLAVDL